MEYRALGRSELKVSAVCLGTMTFGQQNSEAEGHAQLDRAVAAGINFIDTAEMYPVPARAETYGATERIVGSWLKRQARDQVVIATKAAGPARRMEWIRGGPLAFDLANLRRALEDSLQRLQTDYVDLYQLHWPARNQPMFGQWQFEPEQERESTPLRETLEALAVLVQEGKIRQVGVSNEHPWGIMEFLRLAREHGLPAIASTQNAYNLINRLYDTGGLSEVCFRERVSLLAYSPLAFGHLSGKYLADAKAAGRITAFPGFGQRYEKVNVPPALAAYRELAARHGLSMTGLALAFCYNRPGVTSTIIGATSLAQLEENLEAWERRPGAEQWRAIQADIDAVHQRYPNPAL